MKISRQKYTDCLVEKAKAFAINAHGAQPYGNGLHSDHLQDVEDVLFEFYLTDTNLRAAAWLHDVVEDTSITLDDLRAEGFPEQVVLMVDAVTNQPGINRKERNTKTYPRIAANVNAIKLKLADRLSNVRASIRNNESLLSMYKKEYPDFRDALYYKSIGDAYDDYAFAVIWSKLDDLLLD
jgi:(p)ppGpp synthase/HD superfamily hydrolase